MDIAALSMAMAQNQVQSNTGIALMDKVMNMAEQQGSELEKMFGEISNKTPAHPSLGNQIDIQI